MELQSNDVVYACKMLGVSEDDLEVHMKIFGMTEATQDVPHYPMRRAWKINVPAPYEYSELMGEPFLHREARMLERMVNPGELEVVPWEDTQGRSSWKRKKHKKKKKKRRKHREQILESYIPSPE